MAAHASGRALRAIVLLMSVALAAPAHAALVAWWPFDGDATDRSGHGHGGTPNASVAYSGDVPSAIAGGQSLDLDGNAWVDVAADAALNTSPFSLTFWINQDGATQNGPHERTTSRGSDRFETAVAGSGELNYYFPATGWRSTGHSLPSTGWSHAAYVSDGTQMRLYVDGRQEFAGPTSTPTNFLRIGARHNNIEGIEAKMDDVAHWDHALSPLEVRSLNTGLGTPGNLHRLELRGLTVDSDPTAWALSTVRTSGGGMGDWTPSAPPPAASTFTLAAPSSGLGAINNAATDLGIAGTLNGDGGNGSPTGVQFYRTEFFLTGFQGLGAEIVLAVDNGAQVFINGTEIARETSFSAANWAPPYSTLTIHPDGSIGAVSLFDQVAASFTGWRCGWNELILAVRNPDPEGLGAGGIAFRMDLVYSIPEPGTLGLLALGGVAAALRRRRRKKDGESAGQDGPDVLEEGEGV